jgi:hypothetical protein
VFLPWPVITLTSITLRGEAVNMDDVVWNGSVIDLTNTNLNTSKGRMGVGEDYVHTSPLKHEDGVVSLTGTFGYTLENVDPLTKPPTNLPAPIIRATTLIAAAWSGLYSVERVGLDGSRVSIASSAIPKEVYSLLANFKPLVV